MTETGRFTVGVFQDVAWARRGIEALLGDGFAAESITILAKESPDVTTLIEGTLGAPGERLDVKGVGAVLARGTLVPALQGSDQGLATRGLGGVMTRAGFQAHDGYIYETLAGRGGILVGIQTDPRSADALAKLHAYGGGNAAIGAWTGRL